jgi:phosphoribosylformylglycinamidine synthase
LFGLLEKPALLDEFQIVCIPGGFSYGDDIGAGVIFSRQLRGRLGDAINRFLQADKLVLGICNGFQVLLKAGILPQGSAGWPPSARDVPQATLTWNDNGKYTALWVRLGVESQQNVFLRGIDEIELPIAHGEGRIVVRSPDVIHSWRRNGQIALCYRPRAASKPVGALAAVGASRGQMREGTDDAILPFPENPNGSTANIAGLGDPTGRVLGLMPHPERFLHATQHPQWTRRRLTGDGAGLKIFRNAVEYFAAT